jgi:hypothetical protein
MTTPGVDGVADEREHRRGGSCSTAAPRSSTPPSTRPEIRSRV